MVFSSAEPWSQRAIALAHAPALTPAFRCWACLRFDVHFISLKLFILLSTWYIRYVSTYNIHCGVTDSNFSVELWVNLLVFTFSC